MTLADLVQEIPLLRELYKNHPKLQNLRNQGEYPQNSKNEYLNIESIINEPNQKQILSKESLLEIMEYIDNYLKI